MQPLNAPRWRRLDSTMKSNGRTTPTRSPLAHHQLNAAVLLTLARTTLKKLQAARRAARARRPMCMLLPTSLPIFSKPTNRSWARIIRSTRRGSAQSSASTEVVAIVDGADEGAAVAAEAAAAAAAAEAAAAVEVEVEGVAE
jgi:hypothetical protein